MPKLNDHGLGGGGKALGIPVYPLNTTSVLQKDDVNGTFKQLYGETTATAPEDIHQEASCTIGDEMYFIGTDNYAEHCYKYNVKTRIWTRLKDCGNKASKYWAVPIGTDIYYSNELAIFKYDTLTDSHKALYSANSSTPYFHTSSACTDGQNIYIFGGNYSSSYRTRAYMYDVLNNTIHGLTDIPVAMYEHGCVYGGDGFIYLFGGYSNPTSAYRFHIASHVYETLTTIPFKYNLGMIVKINNHIYLINSQTNPYEKVLYTYNIVTQNYTQLTNTNLSRNCGHAGVVDGIIYMIGGYGGFKTGDSMLVFKAITLSVLLQKLLKGIKCYTDGDVMVDCIKEINGQLFLDGGTTLEKVNGAVTIPTDGEYALVGSNYATIGG